jgi:predicted secreted protein
MKKSPVLLPGVLLFIVFFCYCFSCPVVLAENSLLKIQAVPDQNSVKGGMMFLVQAQAANASSDTTVEFWSNTCSYEKHWVTDNAEVFIQSWTCNENTLEQITLGPGEIYSKNIILYIPKTDKTEPVTFRLGFKRMSENGDIAEPLWSDPVTMQVIVPDEMKEVVASASTETVSQTPDPVQDDSVEENEMPSAMLPAPSVPEGSQPLVFQDPGVPINVFSDEEFSIALASNPSTGFGWKMTLPEDQKTIQFLGSGYVASQNVMPGAPGEEVYKFKAVTSGETKADFVYERPWETKTAPVRKIFTILVRENS